MNIVIKKVDFKKFAEILFDLNVSVFTESYHTHAKDLETFIKDYKNCLVFMAYDKTKPVGFLMFQKKQEVFEIEELGLLPKYQHQGIAKQLMQEFFQYIGKGKAQLLTHSHNSSALIFYLKHGFTLSEWKEGQPWVLLKRE